MKKTIVLCILTIGLFSLNAQRQMNTLSLEEIGTALEKMQTEGVEKDEMVSFLFSCSALQIPFSDSICAFAKTIPEALAQSQTNGDQILKTDDKTFAVELENYQASTMKSITFLNIYYFKNKKLRMFECRSEGILEQTIETDDGRIALTILSRNIKIAKRGKIIVDIDTSSQ